MDILAPQLIWISGRCYRVNQIYDENIQKPENGTQQYIEDDLYNDEDDIDDFIIDLTNDNRYRSSFHIPSIFFSQIIGSKGATKKRIEAETRTQIRIPKPGVEGDVVIIGPTRQSVSSARRKINLIVLAARNKHQFTHFLCVPFKTSEIKSSFNKFKNEILSDQEIIGLDASLFQNPEKLHLTIGTLTLMDNDDRAEAAQLLKDCQETVIKPILDEYKRIELNLSGLEYMNDDPSAVDVLYGKIDSEPMQKIADGILNYFIEHDLMQRKIDNNVKIHVTLINSLFRDELNNNSDEQFQQQNHHQRRQTFDARKILEKYENFSFGKQFLTEIHLSQRYSTACDGFYEATGIIKV